MWVKSGAETNNALREAAESLDRAGAEMLGVVVNSVKPGTLKHLAHEKYGPSSRGSGWLRSGFRIPRFGRFGMRRLVQVAAASVTSGLRR